MSLMKNFALSIMLFVFISISLSLTGQRTYFFTEQWSMTGQISLSKFHGDLVDMNNPVFDNTPFTKFFYQDRQLVFGYTLEKKINIYYGVRGNLSYGRVKSTKESLNQYFRANVFEYTIVGTVDATNLILGYSRYRRWSIYGYLGIGFTESRTWKRDITTEQIVGTNGFGVPKHEGGRYVPMTETVIPIGLGFRYSFMKEFSANFEISMHPIKTDKLDATISKNIITEGYGLITFGATYHFVLPHSWKVMKRHPRYKGRSRDPAIKAFRRRKY